MKKIYRVLPLVIVIAFGLTACTTQVEDTTTQADLALCEENASELSQELELCSQELLALSGLTIADTETETETTEGPTVEDVTVIVDTEEIFADQPKYAVGNYSGNTAQLNDYAHNNGHNFTTKVAPTKMYVTLKKAVETKGRNLILYVNPKGVSRYCGGRFVTDVEVGTKTFTFDLTDMDIQGSNCDSNRTKKFGNATEIRVGGYITEYNGNKLSNIYFE